MTDKRKWYDGMFSTEDWWAFWLGGFFVILGILAAVTHLPLTGWIVKFKGWVDISHAFGSAQKGLMGPWASLIVSYIIFTAVTAAAAAIMKWNVKDYIAAWTIIFVLTVVAYIIGKHAYISAPATKWHKFGLESGLQLGGAYYIFALVIGLIIGNFAPKSFIDFMKKGARPEWFIKIAIVCLGAKLGVKALESAHFAAHLIISGICATIAGYLLYWPLAYLLLRRGFGYSREWSACFASASSICGVSAAIATAGAVRAKPIIPVLLSTLVVVYATVQLILYPPILTKFLLHEPIVAGSSLGLAIKTDGADAASGAILDELMRSAAQLKLGVIWEEGWITLSSIMTKIWIDMFIGLWAFILAVIWVAYFEKRKAGEKIPKIEIWFRFPKFVLGYFFAMLIVMILGFGNIVPVKDLIAGVKPVEGALRHLFFLLTFTSIGIVTDFRELRKAGLGKLAVAYGLVIFCIVTPLALLIAWVFHHGMMPPVVKNMIGG
ncbi:Inner membrane protein [Dissulfuribacter thermophilus]|uniref:Inner membrane protein n=1 Tax=Dissulfuribacter thermophilus TaxID=1156395 RepID=A0A1B9F3D8_9BACT|nr:putative sulfate exporter family transporter [Dissulfuribacter thermophilus]OCC14335.1 Inner membrane protein [Dissulfuribacter thermophilus]